MRRKKKRHAQAGLENQRKEKGNIAQQQKKGQLAREKKNK